MIQECISEGIERENKQDEISKSFDKYIDWLKNNLQIIPKADSIIYGREMLLVPVKRIFYYSGFESDYELNQEIDICLAFENGELRKKKWRDEFGSGWMNDVYATINIPKLQIEVYKNQKNLYNTLKIFGDKFGFKKIIKHHSD